MAVVPDSLRASRYNWGEESVAYLSQLGFKDVDFRTYSGPFCLLLRPSLRWKLASGLTLHRRRRADTLDRGVSV
jgi:hypothetical protein